VIGEKYTFSTLSNYGGFTATIVPIPSGADRALVRMKGWPTTSKTFRLRRDAVNWARKTEDEMVRGAYISRSGSERMTAQEASQRYLAEVNSTKKPTTQRSENITAGHLTAFLDKYSMAALRSELVAAYRDHRLASGKSNNTVRIELCSGQVISDTTISSFSAILRS